MTKDEIKNMDFKEFRAQIEDLKRSIKLQLTEQKCMDYTSMMLSM